MISIYKEFKEFSKKHNLFDGISFVVAGVSGGVDSMVMLSLLIDLCKERNIALAVAHLNHMLRGENSYRDEELVRDFCNRNGIDFYSRRTDVAKYASDNKISIEMGGRELRYKFFYEVAERCSSSAIATGHTLDDHIETIILRLFKGTGLKGMAGIPVKMGKIIRPIRFARKSELYSYAALNSIPYSEDHTNYESHYQRNIIRNKVLPEVLHNINPSAISSISNLSEIISEVYKFVCESVEKVKEEVTIDRNENQIVIDILNLCRNPKAIVDEVIRQSIFEVKGDLIQIDFQVMKNLSRLVENKITGKYIEIDKDLIANVDRDYLIIFNLAPLKWDNFVVELNKTYETNFFTFSTQEVPLSQYHNPPADRSYEFIDKDRVDRRMVLRHWREGDKFYPIGLNHSKRVSDLFTDLKVPRIKKNLIPILESSGSIVWVCGLRLGNPFKVTSSTKEILKLVYREK